MLNITTQQNENGLTIALEGRLDTNTAADFKKTLEEKLPGTKHLEFDFEKLEYVSSAGLRALVFAMQAMEEQGTLIIRNVGDFVREILKDSGFLANLNIQ
jgi:anti-sigma B factor antagonist